MAPDLVRPDQIRQTRTKSGARFGPAGPNLRPDQIWCDTGRGGTPTFGAERFTSRFRLLLVRLYQVISTSFKEAYL